MPRVYRFFLNKSDTVDLSQGLVLLKDKDLIHQIKNVLRLHDDSPESLEFMDGSGMVFQSKITNFDSKQISCNIYHQYFSKRELEQKITFFLPIIKTEAFEFMLKKLTELGVQKFIPVIFSRSQKQYISALSSDKSSLRLNKIIKEAVEQCEGALLPELSKIIEFKEIEQYSQGIQTKIFAYEKLADDEDVQDKKNTILQDQSLNKEQALLVGPEGGLTDEEARTLLNGGFHSIALGKRLLKAETAAIVLTVIASRT